MRTLQELLHDRPAALAKVESLHNALKDVWVVGGAARALLYPQLPFPNDIDLLLNTSVEKASGGLIRSNSDFETSSNGQGQKLCLPEDNFCMVVTNFDIWSHDLFVWLRGVPCLGDGLAIRVCDNFAIMLPGMAYKQWWLQNPLYAGNPEYIARHAKALERDAGIIWGS